jgi:hypothetical protein
VRCGPNQDGEAGGWSAAWRGDNGDISPKSGESSGAPVTCGGRGIEGRVEATLAQVLVEENTRGWKGDRGGRVPPFIEVGGIKKKGIQRGLDRRTWRQGWRRGGTPADDRQAA